MSRLDALYAAARVARRAITDRCTIEEAIERELADARAKTTRAA